MLTKRRLKLAQLCSLLVPLLLMGAGSAAAAFQPDLMVKLASEDDTSYIGRGVYESPATLQSKSQAAFGGATAVYRCLLQNAGDAADTFVLKGTAGGSGFTVQYLDENGADRTADVSGAGLTTAPVDPGQSTSLLVRVTPTVTTLGASYRVSIAASSLTDAVKIDQVKAETVVCGSKAAVIVSVPPDRAGVPGSVVNYSYSVTNVGSVVNTFSLVPAYPPGWDSVIYADDGAGGGVPGDGVRQNGENNETVSTGALPPGSSYRFFLSVTVPRSSSDGAHAETRLAVTGQDTAATADMVTTTATAATITVLEDVRNITLGGPFAPTADAYPGDTLEYRMSITNSGQASATVVSIDTPLPQNMVYQGGTLRIDTSAQGDGAPCPVAQCGWVRQAGGTIVGRLGQGATDTAGGELLPGRSLYVFYRVKVE